MVDDTLRQNQHHKEPNRKWPKLSPQVTELQKATFSALTLVNGGAIVAILTFVGNLTSNESCRQNYIISLNWILGALGCFAFGVVLSVLAMMAGLFWAHAWTHTLPAPVKVMDVSIRYYVWVLGGSGFCFFLGSVAAFCSMVFA